MGVNISKAIAVIRKFVVSQIAADAETRAAIDAMTDDEIINYADNLLSEAKEDNRKLRERLEAK